LQPGHGVLFYKRITSYGLIKNIGMKESLDIRKTVIWRLVIPFLGLSLALNMSLITYCIDELGWEFFHNQTFFIHTFIFLLLVVVFVFFFNRVGIK